MRSGDWGAETCFFGSEPDLSSEMGVGADMVEEWSVMEGGEGRRSTESKLCKLLSWCELPVSGQWCRSRREGSEESRVVVWEWGDMDVPLCLCLPLGYRWQSE